MPLDPALQRIFDFATEGDEPSQPSTGTQAQRPRPQRPGWVQSMETNPLFGAERWQDQGQPVDRRVADFLDTHRRLGYRDDAPRVQEQLQAHFPGVDAASVANRYDQERRLQEARDRASHSEETYGGYLLRRVVPFGSTAFNFAENLRYNHAMQRYREGRASNDGTLGSLRSSLGFKSGSDFDEIARHERLQQIDQERDTGESALSGVAHIPAFVGETLMGGAVVGRAATALGLGAGATAGAEAAARTAPMLGSMGLREVITNTAAYAGRTAAMTAATPAMWLPDAERRAAESGTSRFAWENYPSAFLLGALQVGVLGKVANVGRATIANSGGLGTLGRYGAGVAAGTATGMAGQQISDVIAGVTGLHGHLQDPDKEGYGILGALYRDKGSEAMKMAAVQAMTFAAFSMLHGAPKADPIMDAYDAAAKRLRGQGLSEKAIGEALNRPTDMLAEESARNPSMSRAEAEALFESETGPVRDLGLKLAEQFPETAPQAAPQAKPAEQPTEQPAGQPTEPAAEPAKPEATVIPEPTPEPARNPQAVEPMPQAAAESHPVFGALMRDLARQREDAAQAMRERGISRQRAESQLDSITKSILDPSITTEELARLFKKLPDKNLRAYAEELLNRRSDLLLGREQAPGQQAPAAEPASAQPPDGAATEELSPKQRAHVEKKVKELGSMEAVKKAYNDDSIFSQYAEKFAESQFGKAPEPAAPAVEPAAAEAAPQAPAQPAPEAPQPMQRPPKGTEQSSPEYQQYFHELDARISNLRQALKGLGGSGGYVRGEEAKAEAIFANEGIEGIKRKYGTESIRDRYIAEYLKRKLAGEGDWAEYLMDQRRKAEAQERNPPKGYRPLGGINEIAQAYKQRMADIDARAEAAKAQLTEQMKNASFAEEMQMARERPDPIVNSELSAREQTVKSLKETKDLFDELGGAQFPDASRLNTEAGNAMAREAHSGNHITRAVSYFIDHLVGDIAPEQAKTLGATFLEMRRRGAVEKIKAEIDGMKDLGHELEGKELRQFEQRMAKLHAKLEAWDNRQFIGAEDSPLQSEKDYHEVIASKEFQDMLQKWKKDFGPQMDNWYNLARGELSDAEIDTLTQMDGLPIHLIRVNPGAEKTPGTVTFGSSRGNLANPKMRKNAYENEATLQSEAYETDIREIIRRSISDVVPKALKAETNRILQQKGIAERGAPGRVEGYTEFPDVFKRDPLGKTSLFVKNEAAAEYRQLQNVDPRWNAIPGMHLLSKISLSGVTSGTAHIKNVLTNLFKPGVWQQLPKLVDHVRDLWADNTTSKRDLYELAKIGAGREPGSEVGQWAGGNKNPLNWMHKFIEVADNAMRLTLVDAYKNLHQKHGKGIYDPATPEGERSMRDFANQVGMYEKRAQNAVIVWLRDTGIGPYATAGINYAIQGLKTLIGGHGIRTPGGILGKTDLKLRAEMYAKVISVGLAIPAAYNFIRWGNVFGDDNTPIGALKIGMKDNGETRYFDLAGMTGFTRGARMTGLMALLEGGRTGASANEITKQGLSQFAGAITHPAIGPGVAFGRAALFGIDSHGHNIAPTDQPRNIFGLQTQTGNQFAENMRAAVLQANPLGSAVTGAQSPGREHSWEDTISQAIGAQSMGYRLRGDVLANAVGQHLRELRDQRELHQRSIEPGQARTPFTQEQEYHQLEQIHRRMVRLQQELRGEWHGSGGMRRVAAPDDDRQSQIREMLNRLARQAVDSARRS